MTSQRGSSYSDTLENDTSVTEPNNDAGLDISFELKETLDITRGKGRETESPREGAKIDVDPGPQPSVSNAPGVCSSSSSSSVCRICQLNSLESEATLDTSRCQCKGSLSKVHRSCLELWVQYRGSNQCEICGSRFPDIPNPASLHGAGRLQTFLPLPTPNDAYYFQTLESIRLQLMQIEPINRRKRTAIAGFLVFLFLITGVTAVLTVGADQDFRKANSNPWTSDADLRKSHVVFSVCLSFLFFCITLTSGLLLMWIVFEIYFYMRRRRIYREAAERLVNNVASQL